MKVGMILPLMEFQFRNFVSKVRPNRKIKTRHQPERMEEGSHQDSGIESLPSELIFHILKYLDTSSISSLAKTNKKWNLLLQEESVFEYLLKEAGVQVIDVNPNEKKKKRFDPQGNRVLTVKSFREGYQNFQKSWEWSIKGGGWSCESNSARVLTTLEKVLPKTQPRWLIFRNDRKIQRNSSSFDLDIFFVEFTPQNVPNNPRVAYRSGGQLLFQKLFDLIQTQIQASRQGEPLCFNSEFQRVDSWQELGIMVGRLYATS
eukprot:TRINITY_DN3032_c0_g3_i2.p1 TRINITY_DN3032_c0_g3~~TRINITY_DN3032_c0_g3_i2.p1  ORF type:complete len:260 (-),score=50.09 TRINITY_DN3032_c0_g3_i2:54-833(-)